MEDKNIRQLHRQLVLAEEAEAAAAVELADPQQDARIVSDVIKRLESKGELAPSHDTEPPPVTERPLPQVESRPSAGRSGSRSGSRAGALSFQRSWIGKAAAYSGVMATAVLGLMLFLREPTGPQPRESLAIYGITVPPDDKVAGIGPAPSALSPVAAPARLSLDSILQVDLRPARQVSKDVSAVAFLKEGRGQITPWNVTFDRSEAGVFQLRGRVRDLPGIGLGRWELLVAVGYPDRLPSRSDLAQRLTHGEVSAGEGWQLLSGSLEIVDPKQIR